MHWCWSCACELCVPWPIKTHTSRAALPMGMWHIRNQAQKMWKAGLSKRLRHPHSSLYCTEEGGSSQPVVGWTNWGTGLQLILEACGAWTPTWVLGLHEVWPCSRKYVTGGGRTFGFQQLHTFPDVLSASCLQFKIWTLAILIQAPCLPAVKVTACCLWTVSPSKLLLL